MKLVNRAFSVGVVTGALGLVIACSSSDSSTSSGGTSGSGTSGTGTSGTGTSGTGTSGTGTSGTGTSGTGTSGTGTSGTSGTPEAGTDAAEAAATGKANGAVCAGDGECTSMHCISQGMGGPGGAGGSFCTISCTMPGVTGDTAECGATEFTGKCSGMSYCQIK